VGRLLRDNSGSVLVPYTLVLPLFLVVTLGTVDIAFMLGAGEQGRLRRSA
jgi:Flp pilus assembly protein TadG